MTLNDVPILVCPCGRRLRAPGAVPGRIGRCPSCGGELRVPDRVADPDPVAATAARPRKKKTRKASSSSNPTEIWQGLVKPPVGPEGIRESLLYPLRGATGIALLVLLPPIFWITTVPFITAVHAWSGGTRSFDLGLMFLLLPAGMGLGLALGYTLLYLGAVASSSAVGDLHHPRWPDWDLSSIAFGLGRWAWAGLVGVIAGVFPATVYWMYCGDINLFDAMILAELLAIGASYAQMALLASILHDDALAANPFTVLSAIWRVGRGYLAPCLLAGAAMVVAGTVLMATFEVQNGALSAFLYWLFWVVTLYEAMVVLRVLGLFYRDHARALGWFRDRTGWGV